MGSNTEGLFAIRQGQGVCLSPAAHPEMSQLTALGECADEDCGCHRQRRPWVRTQFREVIVQRSFAAYRSLQQPVRYVGVGAGLLLGDLEILCALQAAGVPVDGVVFVDPAYADDEGGRFHQALAQAASLLAPVPVTAYPSTTEFAAACLQGKERSVIIYVQADAADVSKKQARALASIALLAGGEAFRLTNQGALQPATMDVWQRNSFPLPARSTGASPPGSALGLARAKPTDEPNRDVRQAAEDLASSLVDTIDANSLLTDVVARAPLIINGGRGSRGS